MGTPLEEVRWIHGAPPGVPCEDPPLQVHRHDPDTWVLRIGKHFSFEANFLTLLAGTDRAVLFDTGAPPDPGSPFGILPLRATVDALLAGHPGGRELIVAHTHTHGDHVHWDGQFADRPNTTVVGHDLAAVQAFWSLPDWPEGQATLDLGDRSLTVFPLPGHEARHIAVHDPRTGILLTGDTLYPGLVTIRDWPAFRASARRLAAFARAHRVTHVLGNHVEMSRTPGRLYPLGTTYQPDELPLPMTAQDIEDLHALCEALGDAPRDTTLPRFALALVEP